MSHGAVIEPVLVVLPVTELTTELATVEGMLHELPEARPMPKPVNPNGLPSAVCKLPRFNEAMPRVLPNPVDGQKVDPDVLGRVGRSLRL